MNRYLRRFPATCILLLSLLCLLTRVADAGFKINIGKAVKTVEDIKDDKRLKQLKALLPISVEEEVILGARVAAQIQNSYGIYHNDTIERYLALVGTAVAWQGSRNELTYSFTVLDSDEINAFAAPGGHVMISRGLLSAMRNEAELACVLGHELWHIEAKHEVKRVESAQRVGTLTNEALAAMTDQELDEIADHCYSILEKGRSREDELEADIRGVSLAAAVGYAPQAMIELLGRLEESPSTGPLKKLTATHPALSDRIKTLKKETFENASNTLLEERFRKHVTSNLGS